MMTEKDLRWNKFIEEISLRELSALSPVQKTAVLCFRYDAEMNSDGYSGFIDSYPETDPNELEAAILAVAYPEIADNYRKAVRDGERDEWAETDAAYYKFSPSLCDCLMRYVEDNRDIIFL